MSRASPFKQSKKRSLKVDGVDYPTLSPVVESLDFATPLPFNTRSSERPNGSIKTNRIFQKNQKGHSRTATSFFQNEMSIHQIVLSETTKSFFQNHGMILPETTKSFIQNHQTILSGITKTSFQNHPMGLLGTTKRFFKSLQKYFHNRKVLSND